MKSALIVYERAQIPGIAGYLATQSSGKREEITIIALGADVEFELTKRDITHESGKGLRQASHYESMRYAKEVGRDIFDDPHFSFLSYRDISFKTVFTPMLQSYILTAQYYVDVFTSLVKERPEFKRIILVPVPRVISETYGVLAGVDATLPEDSARLVCEASGVEVEVAYEKVTAVKQNGLFTFKRALFGAALSVMNVGIRLIQPRKRIRILASDYWGNLEQLVSALPESELILLDRVELLNAGAANIWNHRMQATHLESFVPHKLKARDSGLVEGFVQEGEAAIKESVHIAGATFRGNTLVPLIEKAVRHFVAQGSTAAIRATNGAYAICEKMKPDIVLLRASFSLQIHFPILSLVAKQLNIPAIELQHGHFYLGPVTFITEPPIEYVATYGPLTNSQFKRFGYTDETLLTVGSPRFDRYKEIREARAAKKENEVFTIAATVPAIHPESWSDSYEVFDYLKSIAHAASKLGKVHVILKLRPVADNEAFYHDVIARAFGKVPYTIAQYEPLFDVIAQSDVFVSLFSTTVVEGLVSGTPVIYNGSIEFHGALSVEFADYEKAGALRIVKSEAEFADALDVLHKNRSVREEMVERADSFMHEHFLFDGNASERLATYVRKLVE